MKKKILIIDDEPSITRSMKINLERTAQYEVLTENDSTNAIAAARAFQPDLIFSDLMMPGMSGDEVGAALREDAALGKIPVIFLTAIVTKEEAGESVMVSGGNLFIAKPISLNALVACIEEHTKAVAIRMPALTP